MISRHLASAPRPHRAGLLLARSSAASRLSKSSLSSAGRSPCHGHMTFSAAAPSFAPPKKARGRSSSMKLGDLPQGIVESDAIADEEVEPETTYPTVIQQAKDHMTKYHGCVLITRVGNFYELYFDQAKHWGVQLGLKVAYRKTNKKTNAQPVPMAGFPFFQLDRYLKVFVQEHGQKVAIAEEVAIDPSQRVKAGGLMFDRQVKRIITPGTLIDESFLSPAAHNYLLSVFLHPPSLIGETSGHFLPDAPVGLAWLDLSSGDFFTQSSTLASLSSAISRIGPREILFDPSLLSTADPLLGPVLAESGGRTTYYSANDQDDRSALLSLAENAGIDSDSMSRLAEEEARSVSTLLGYVSDQLPGLKLRLLRLTKYEAREHMNIDKHTLRGLEITHTMRDGVTSGSLLHSVQRTSTWSGGRLLAERLKAPLTSVEEINQRLDLVDVFLKDEQLSEEIVTLLGSTTDSFRILQSVACGKGDAESLLSLSRTVSLTGQIAGVLDRASQRHEPLNGLVTRFQLEGPSRISEKITNAIDEEELTAQHRQEEDEAAVAASMAREAISAEASGDMAALNKRLSSRRFSRPLRSGDANLAGEGDIWIMRRDASTTLRKLHDALEGLYEEKTALEEEWRTANDATSLTLRMTPSLGYIVHVAGKDAKRGLSSLESARAVSSSKSTRSYYVPEWTALGKRLDETKLRIRAEEQQIFRELRDGVCNEIVALRKNATIVDELDVACSSAKLSRERDLVRPTLTDSTEMTIIGGRHMTVEASLAAAGRTFTANDCILGQQPAGSGPDSAAERIQLITGPNMAGKSTYLRQTALTAILAQTGLHVPAAHATLGVVDAVFARIGAADNLANDQSTFMVEMEETAAILRAATARSLVVMDEVGRGTTPAAGAAVAFAVLDALRRAAVARVLFATHFHRLADPDRAGAWPALGCWATRVVDERLPDGAASFRFVHRLQRGVNRQSHALKVAKLAGIPDDTIRVAARVLEEEGLEQA